jgi:hypothetical protein
MNEIKITESTEIKTMTVADLLTAQDVGDIATPDIQRPAGVWSAEQCAKLEDTIMRGWGIGTISIVEIIREGKILRLLVDGLQRLTALRAQRDAAQAALDAADIAYAAAVDEGAKLDANPAADPAAKAAADTAIKAAFEDYNAARNRYTVLSEYQVAVTVTTTNDPTTAAELFVRLNNGTPLSKIQRGTAGLKSDVLAWARTYAELLPDPMPGKIGRDEAAFIFAACAVNKKRMTTNGPACIKYLATLADPAELPAADTIAPAAAAYVAAMTKAGNTHMLSAQYFIPYVLGSAAAEHTLTADDWAKYVVELGRIKGERVRTMTPAKGKAETQETTRRKDKDDDNRLLWAQVDDDKSNAARATVARYSAVSLGDLYARIQNQLTPGDYGYKTAVKAGKVAPAPATVAETAAAIEEMLA